MSIFASVLSIGVHLFPTATLDDPSIVNNQKPLNLNDERRPPRTDVIDCYDHDAEQARAG